MPDQSALYLFDRSGSEDPEIVSPLHAAHRTIMGGGTQKRSSVEGALSCSGNLRSC
jgi:hypothetical protein